jgi:hypothetical protein
MLPALLTALALAASPGAPYDPFEDPPPGGGERQGLQLTAWGGALTGAPGSGASGGALAGGEVGWRFDSLDLSVQALAARLGPGSAGAAPLLLARLGQRLEGRHGMEGSFTLGLGAARRERWEPWFQVALGGRVDLGPLFLAAELGFEQADLIRLAGGVGIRL